MRKIVLKTATLCILLICGCGKAEKTPDVSRATAPNTTTSNEGPAEPEEVVLPDDSALMQQPEDLLAGVSRAICYSGFRNGQHPDRGEGARNPSEAEILEDLQILTRDNNFSLIRVYDSGENSATILKLIKENGFDIKLMLGIWLKAELSNHETCAWLNEPIPAGTLAENRVSNGQEIERGIRLANEYPEIVVAVNVGNEALVDWNDHKVATESVIDYVKRVKAAIAQPVTVAENYKWWAEQGKPLAEVVDFVAIHTYPVWEGKDINEGMAFTIENLNEVRAALPDSRLLISEAGWASIGSEFGRRANEDKQQQYYNELLAWADRMNITTFFFSAFDETWKGDPNNKQGAEKHWGIFTSDRKAKQVMQPLYPDLK